MFRSFLAISVLLSILLPNAKLYVDAISIKNNKSLSVQELLSTLTLKRPTLFFRSEFRPKIYRRDIQNLIGFYKINGFLDINIISQYKTTSNQYVHITYEIEEGSQYQFDKLIISGNKFISKKQISQYFQQGIGNNYNPTFIRNQLLILKKEYLRNGNLDIFIQEELIIDEHDISLRINLSEGIHYKIKDIHILGLGTVDKKYISREIIFKIGEIYNIDKIDLSRKRIFDSGLFSSVEILPDIIQEDSGYVDIKIKIREYKPSYIEAEFGFSQLSAWQNNILKPGLDINAKWIIGNIMNSASSFIISGGIASEIDIQSIEHKHNLLQLHTKITYKSPWIFNFRVPSNFNIFYEIDNVKSDNLERFGVSHIVHLEKSLTSRYEIKSTYQVINSDYTYTNQYSEPVRSIELNYITNKVQNIVRPTGGYNLRLTSTVFGTFLGGRRNFIKITSEYRKYYGILKRGIIAYRFKFGYIYNLNSDDILPPYYTFELGGQSSLRGWASTLSFDRDKLIYDMVNMEYRFPVYKKWGGELFIDAGRLYNQISEFSITNLSWNYGIGVTYDTSFGPLRIEYAIPIVRPNNYQETVSDGDSNETGKLHVSLLYMF